MTPRRRSAASILVFVALAFGFVALPALDAARELSPLVYTIRFPDPASKSFTVEIDVPTDKRASVDLMMAIWSPGFYGLQNYADRVTNFAANAADGTALDVTKPTPSRWTVATGGRPSFVVSYTVAAPRGSNLSNGTTETSAVIIGPATYITLVRDGASHGRSPARAAALVEGLDDIARRRGRRAAESLRRARLRHARGLADPRGRRSLRQRRSPSAASSITGRTSGRPSGTARKSRRCSRRSSRSTSASGARCPTGNTSSSTSSRAAAEDRASST